MTATTTKPVKLVIPPGNGIVNNALMLDGAEKTIYCAPFQKLVDPYTLQSKRIEEFGRKLAAFDGATSLSRLASLLWTSIRC